MHRTQISLEDEQYQALLRESRKRRVSLSAIIRELVRKGLSSDDDPANPLDRLAGIAEGTGEPVGREHNRFLYGKRNR
jgi:two-component sensor histidine kinase